MRWESAAACALAVIVSTGCADSKAPAPPASTAPAATVAPATSAPTVAESEYGVPECDAFMKSWAACVDSKVPAEARAAYKASFDAAKTSYTQAASTPQGKSTLATVCTQQLAATRQALAGYGCSW